jgi:trehalose 6-phosphate synthase/phosphatase
MNEFFINVPGSLIEIKETSMAWHFRNIPSAQGIRLSEELKEKLLGLCNDHDLRILNGKKTIEVINRTINKGTAVRHLVSNNAYDYVMAFGDDITDEDMFTMLSRHGYKSTVKIGEGETTARYYLKNYLAVRRFLKLLLGWFSAENTT